jgi:hypothetical protein
VTCSGKKDDHNMYLELSEFEKKQTIGYDTGVGQPIGHLSEIGFFVPSMEKAMDKLRPQGWEVTSAIDVEGAKMYKISNRVTPSIPVELIDYEGGRLESLNTMARSDSLISNVIQIGIVVSDVNKAIKHFFLESGS